jgi:hypothetical protein
MSNLKAQVPSYRKKKVGNRKYGCVSLPDGLGRRRDILLGTYGTKESKAEYARVITEWLAADRRLPQTRGTFRAGAASDLTINELILAFLPHAERHYRHADGTATSELEDVKLSMRPLKALYGLTLAKDFGPLSLKACPEQMIRQPITRKVKVVDPATGKKEWREKLLRIGLARGVVNQRIGRIRRLFKWAVENELVPPSVLQGGQRNTSVSKSHRTGLLRLSPGHPARCRFVECLCTRAFGRRYFQSFLRIFLNSSPLCDLALRYSFMPTVMTVWFAIATDFSRLAR